MVGLHGCSAWRPAWCPPQRRVGSCRKGHTWSTFTFKGIRPLTFNGHVRTSATSSLPSGSGTFVCVCARCRLSGAFQALFRTLAACMPPLAAARVEHALHFRAVTDPRQNEHCRTHIILPCRDTSTTKQTQVRVPARPRIRTAQERPTHDRAPASQSRCAQVVWCYRVLPSILVSGQTGKDGSTERVRLKWSVLSRVRP